MVLFSKGGSGGQRRRDAAYALMLQARNVLGADDDTVISVREHDCGDPDCGPARTVVLVLRPGRPTEAVKIDKPIERVTETDLSAALAATADRLAPCKSPRPANSPTRLDW
jgi:hypothetical protein